MLFLSGAFLLGLREQQGAQTLRAQFVDANDRLREGGGQFATGDEILRLLHHDTHLLQMIGGDTVETARVHDEDGTFHADARHTEDMFVGCAVDIHREELRVA